MLITLAQILITKLFALHKIMYCDEIFENRILRNTNNNDDNKVVL